MIFGIMYTRIVSLEVGDCNLMLVVVHFERMDDGIELFDVWLFVIFERWMMNGIV